MAVSAANAVSPTPATGNPVANGAASMTAGIGNAMGGGFIDSLEAVLGVSGIANGIANGNPNDANDPQFAALAQNKLAAFKSKLMTATAESGAAAINPQLVQQQAIISKLQDTTGSIELPALRAALAKNAATPPQPPAAITPNVAADATANAPAPTGTTTPQPVQPPVPEMSAKGNGSPQPATVPAPATQAAAADPADTAVKNATQQKLLVALAKTADAPVLKDGNADGSKVPNANIGKQTPPKSQALTPDQVIAMATNIAATSGIANTPDAAPAAAQGVAVAEVAIKTAPAAPSVTKVETAAIANAAQTATHAPAQQASVEAQAMPVQFDAQPTKPDGKDSNTSGNSDGKDQSKSGNTANNSAKALAAPNQPAAPTFAASQPSSPAPAAPAQVAHAAPVDASASAGLAGAANATASIPSTAQVAVNLHVAPQTQHTQPDQTAFDALGMTIAAKSQDGERHFDIRLDPAELGKVDVRISVDSDGKAQAHLAAEHPQTLQLLQNDKANLERQLRDAGLNLTNNGLNFSLRGEQQSSTPTFTARNRALSISAVQTADAAPAISLASLAPGDSRLDIRV